MLFNKFISITPFKLRYAYKLKSALEAVIEASDFKLLIKRGVEAFVEEYKEILEEAREGDA
jgi:hypothetical protein